MTLWMVGLGCCLMQSLAADDDGVRLSVMTYNIHHGEGLDGKLDLDRIASVIRKANPDVVCLQEMDNNLPRTQHLVFPQELAKRLGMTAVFHSNYNFDGGEYGNATLTRLEIVSHENHALPNPANVEPRGCLKTLVRTKGGVVQILNTHFGLKPDERKSQAEAVMKQIGNMPTVLVGDFNEGVAKPGVALLLTHFQDVLTLGGAPTTRGFHARIDHILASNAFDVLSSAVIANEETAVASDHLPCVAELKLKVKPDTAEKEGIHDEDDERVSDALR